MRPWECAEGFHYYFSCLLLNIPIRDSIQAIWSPTCHLSSTVPILPTSLLKHCLLSGEESATESINSVCLCYWGSKWGGWTAAGEHPASPTAIVNRQMYGRRTECSFDWPHMCLEGGILDNEDSSILSVPFTVCAFWPWTASCSFAWISNPDPCLLVHCFS